MIPLVSSGLIEGSSSLLPTNCTPSTGPANVDGKCIMGGTSMPLSTRGGSIYGNEWTKSPRCVAYPVYVMNNVPYTRGRVAGNNYDRLANIYTYTRLNDNWANSIWN